MWSWEAENDQAAIEGDGDCADPVAMAFQRVRFSAGTEFPDLESMVVGAGNDITGIKGDGDSADRLPVPRQRAQLVAGAASHTLRVESLEPETT